MRILPLCLFQQLLGGLLVHNSFELLERPKKLHLACFFHKSSFDVLFGHACGVCVENIVSVTAAIEFLVCFAHIRLRCVWRKRALNRHVLKLL